MFFVINIDHHHMQSIKNFDELPFVKECFNLLNLLNFEKGKTYNVESIHVLIE